MGIAVKGLAVDFASAVKDIVTLPVRFYRQELNTVDGNPGLAVLVPSVGGVLAGFGVSMVNGVTPSHAVQFGLASAYVYSATMGYLNKEFTYAEPFTAFPSLNPSSRTPN